MDGRRPRADAVRNRARILAAAEAVFAEHGPAGSTEEVARRAGVAVGTVFRHFPTKQDLLAAILKDLLAQLAATAERLAGDDPADGLFAFLRQVVTEAAARSSVVALLGATGPGLDVARSVGSLGEAVELLVCRAQDAGTVRRDVTGEEVLALLTSVTEGALTGAWSASLRDRVLRVVTDGLRP